MTPANLLAEFTKIASHIDIKTIITAVSTYAGAKATDGIIGEPIKDTAVQTAAQLQRDLERLVKLADMGYIMGQQNVSTKKSQTETFYLPDHMG